MTVLVSILGAVAMIASFFGSLGLLAQIWTNYQKKSCEGFAPPLIFTTILIGASWSAYGFASYYLEHSNALFIAISNLFVLALGCILLYQFIVYKKRKKDSTLQ